MDIPPDILVEKDSLTPLSRAKSMELSHGFAVRCSLCIRPDLMRNILHQLQLLLDIFLSNLSSIAIYRGRRTALPSM